MVKILAVKTYSLQKDGNTKLSENFIVKEFACKDGSDKILVDTELVNVLQKIRDHFGKPITINSAYRNSTYNKKIGGVSNSQHTKGTATDIVVKGISPEDVAKYAEYLLPQKGGLGLYPTFTHIDVRSNRSRWKNFGKEIVVSGFPGYKEPRKELTSANDIIWELSQIIEIKEVDKAVKELEKAEKDNSSLYWILYKIANKSV